MLILYLTTLPNSFISSNSFVLFLMKAVLLIWLSPHIQAGRAWIRATKPVAPFTHQVCQPFPCGSNNVLRKAREPCEARGWHSSRARASHWPPGHRGSGDGDRLQVSMGGDAKSLQEEKAWTVLLTIHAAICEFMRNSSLHANNCAVFKILPQTENKGVEVVHSEYKVLMNKNNR